MQKIWALKLWKRKPICVITALFSFLLLFCAIKIILPCHQYQFEGGRSFDIGIAAPDTIVYDGIHLSPGVYRIELQYDTDTDLTAVCTVADGTVFEGGLLCNGEHLYSGLSRTGYHMWLYEPADNLQVNVSYGGNGSLVTGSLRIVETNLLWTMLLTVFLFLGAAVLAALVFYYYDQAYPIPREKKNAFFWVSLIALAASVPYLCGYNLSGGDLTYHLQRIEGVKDGLLTGQFPVRIEPRWLYDHGYASAVFYCNTFLYFPALLRLLGFPVTAAYNAYGIVINIATAWISYHCFHRIFGRRHIGILCSALYTLSIVRIYKLVITGAVGEGTAITFLPLILYGLYRIFTEDPEEKTYRTAWIPLMLGMSGVLQSHVLTCEVSAGVILLFCLLYLRKVFRRAAFLQLLKGALASVLVSLWFLVPFLDYYLTQDLHIRHVSGRTIQDRGLYLAQLALHFWTSGANTPMADNGMQDSHPVGVGMMLMAGLAVFSILWFSGALKKSEQNLTRFAKISAMTGILLLFMSTRSFPWDKLQAASPVTAALVSSLQFPNRTLGWGSVCLVFVFGFCLQYFESHRRSAALAMAAAAVLGVTSSGMYLSDSANAGQNYLELYNEEGMGFGYISGAEYLIEGTDENRLTFSGPAAGSGTEILSYAGGALRAELECVNYTRDNSFVDLPFLLYKGYRAMDADTGHSLSLCAGDNQTVRVILPPYYAGTLNVRFVSPLYWRISEVISLASLLILLLSWYRFGRRNTPSTVPAPAVPSPSDSFRHFRTQAKQPGQAAPISAVLLVLQIVLLFALLPGCFRGAVLTATFEGDQSIPLIAVADGGEITEMTEGATGTTLRRDLPPLTPGVYQVRVRTNPAAHADLSVCIQYEDEIFHAVRSNGIHMDSNNNEGVFEVYVSDRVTTAYLQCEFAEAGFVDADSADALLGLELWRTSAGNRMLFFIAVLCFAVLDGLILLRRRILAGRVSGSGQLLFWGLLAGVFLAYFPYLTDYIFLETNTAACLNRIASLADSLRQGKLFPPGDILLWIPALLKLIGFPLMSAYKQFVFLTITVTAVCSCHALRTCVKENRTALLGSLLCLLSPYGISCLYEKGAPAEYLAMAFLSLIFCGVRLLFLKRETAKRRRYGVLYVLGGMAALLPCLALFERKTDLLPLVGQVFLSFAAAFVVRRIAEKPSPLKKAVAGIAAALFLLLAIYQVNRIALEADPIWLYNMPETSYLYTDSKGR